jgi:hypothetical protein
MPTTPLLECEVTFISEQEGGRTTVPALSGCVYRPHIVVGDPGQRKAIITGRTIPVKTSMALKVSAGPTNTLTKNISMECSRPARRILN